MKTKKPSAIIYNWDRRGTFTLTSEIYHEENLLDKCIIYSLDDIKNVDEDFAKFKPDIVLSIGQQLMTDDPQIQKRFFCYDKKLDDTIIANDIVAQTTFVNCSNPTPKFSIFTSTYNTGDRIKRTYDSVKSQTFKDWEWVIIDDSTEGETWDILTEISKKDHRVKIHKLLPQTGGNIGLAKNRVASLCDGEWLVELDHDDTLLSQCLEYLDKASNKFPDAGLMYSDVCELYENGDMKYYDHDWSGNWYGRNDNLFDFGYAGHTWVIEDGKRYLAHHYPDINPLTIRFNISMPSHVRVWKKDLYQKIGGHNKNTPVADDFELIVRTFLNTKMLHIKKVLYLQWSNNNTTTNNNSVDINRRARLIRDYYDKQIHSRIEELGKKDWNWDKTKEHSEKLQNNKLTKKFFDEEEILNYIYE